MISRVRITSGNSPLGAGLTDQNGSPRDVVVMHDFIFGEPTPMAPVPEPASIVLTATGLLMLLGITRRSPGKTARRGRLSDGAVERSEAYLFQLVLMGTASTSFTARPHHR